jgi:hypothetical protein
LVFILDVQAEPANLKIRPYAFLLLASYLP